MRDKAVLIYVVKYRSRIYTGPRLVTDVDHLRHGFYWHILFVLTRSDLVTLYGGIILVQH